MARERKFSMDELYMATKKLLLMNGYEGFTISILADYLEVARGTIYKYFDNKEELITEYMLYEMNAYLTELKQIESLPGFDAQFDYLLNIMFKDAEIHKIIQIGQNMKVTTNEKVRENNRKLERLHWEMYTSLQNFIQIGRKEQKLKSHLPDSLILGFIFQSISIPNHNGVPQSQWFQSIKEIIRDGMLNHDN